jgi:hypothetical protein
MRFRGCCIAQSQRLSTFPGQLQLHSAATPEFASAFLQVQRSCSERFWMALQGRFSGRSSNDAYIHFGDGPMAENQMNRIA